VLVVNHPEYFPDGVSVNSRDELKLGPDRPEDAEVEVVPGVSAGTLR
jgi:hypothetical protein